MNFCKKLSYILITIVYGLLGAAFAYSQQDHYDLCHPNIANNRTQYIIGYGSLMSEESKHHTDPTALENHPVRISGFKRGWSIHEDIFNAHGTYLGIYKEKQAKLNAVIYQLANTARLNDYDKREVGYCRIKVKNEQIERLDSAPIATGDVWVYIPEKNKYAGPNLEYPIIQSYVDIFISGCLNLEDKYKLTGFAKECAQSTINWNDAIKNDRSKPIRPLKNLAPYARIDSAFL